jgi:hypothetical protein
MFRKQVALAVMFGFLVQAMASVAQGADATSATVEGKLAVAKSPLRVLYAGKPGSDREANFVAFLTERFATVKTGDYEKFVPEDSEEIDVVIFDWPSIYPRDEQGKIDWKDETMHQPKPPAIDGKFSRPAILIGGAGGGLSHQLHTAINWKCLCLENEAHDVKTDHEIFQGPAPVAIAFERRVKPYDYFLSPGSESLSETMDVWKVKDKSFPEIDPGLVSSRENFTETEGAEVISGGINGKGPTSVAIGRHGNFLLWGFSAQPSEMTESGRNAFANAICYIDKFDGQTAGPVKATYGGRDSWLESIYYLRSLNDAYVAKMAEKITESMRDNPAPKEVLEKMGDDPAAYFRNMMEPFVKQTLAKVPQPIRDECGDDPEKLIRYYRDNLEYLRRDDAGAFVVDADVQELRVSNRSPKLLETCVEMLEKRDRAELAERILARYADQQSGGAAAWREWLDAQREKIRFDENLGKFVPK